MYKLEGYRHNGELTLVDFIYLFFIKLNKKYKTIDDSLDPSDNDYLVCYQGRDRSLGDIHMICESYYPGVTRDKVKTILLDFGINLVGHFCLDIGKRIYSIIDARSGWSALHAGEFDEYGEQIFYKNHMDINKDKINKQLIYEIIEKYGL